MKIVYHQTHHTIGDFEAIFKEIEQTVNNMNGELHLYPELFLTGYPLQDLCLQQEFIQRYEQLIKKINTLAQKSNQTGIILLGGLHYQHDLQAGIPQYITNVIYRLVTGKELDIVYTKQLLPNYDIFDESKYFTPGYESSIISYQDKKLALLICEDMWTSTTYQCDPIKQLVGKEIDLIVNLSASPFHVGKHQQRIQRATEISNLLHAPFAYVNRVGAEDEIIFDGGSFLINGEQTIFQGKFFQAENKLLDFPSPCSSYRSNKIDKDNNWDALFKANLDRSAPPQLKPLTNQECAIILDALCFSIQEYAQKSGMQKFTVALSGGMDSSLVLAIVKKSLKAGQYLEAIYMPGLFSATLSYDLSLKLCQNLKVPMTTLPIKFSHKSVRNLFNDSFGTPLDGVADENIQSRLRGTFLYARSNQIGSMVLNTSNKSEIAVGYSTQYGDSVGALSVLGDLYKTEVFALAKYINQEYGELIPSEIITRPPSAELRENQEDAHSLPPYEILDAILEGLLSYRHSVNDLIEMGYPAETVLKVFQLWKRAEFKRAQFCPIIKVKQKSFGFGYRVPICKSY